MPISVPMRLTARFDFATWAAAFEQGKPSALASRPPMAPA
jgi:hypothetical protein